jgi:bla regulator protein BlaR1
MSALVNATGWALIHFLWQGCVIALLFWLICVFSRDENARLRYWSGLGAYLLSLATVISTFKIYYQPAVDFSSKLLTPEPVNPFIVMSGATPDLWAALQDGIEPSLPFVVVLWSAGVLLMAAKILVGWKRTRRLVREGVSPIPLELQRSVDRLLETLAVSQAVRVLKSSLVKVPMVVGLLKPVILLPASILTGMPHCQLEMVIAHELGHIKRLDYLLNLIQLIIETLLYYHPAIRWMAGRIRQERENCCDDLVVRSCGEPVIYAKALANLEVLRSPAGLMALAASGGDLLGRVRRIVDRELPHNGAGYAQLSMLAIVALVVAVSAQQGLSLQRALVKISDSAFVQPSDIEMKTWSESRAAWAAGVSSYSRTQALTASRDANIKFAPGFGAEDGVSADAKLAKALVSDESQKEGVSILADTVDSGGVRTEPISSPAVQQIRDTSQKEEPVLAAIEPQTTEVQYKATTLVDSPASPDNHPGIFAAPVASDLLVANEVAIKHTPPTPGYESVHTAQPRYPWKARRKGMEGFVQLEFSLDKKGKVEHVAVIDAYPEKVFDRAAMKAMQKWKFAIDEGFDLNTRIRKTFAFNLVNATKIAGRQRNCSATGSRTCGFIPRASTVLYMNPHTSRLASIVN